LVFHVDPPEKVADTIVVNDMGIKYPDGRINGLRASYLLE
jgi:hypothetical protein